MDERKLIQLRRQGWSERRIQRWMEQRQHADITKERAARVRDAQYRQSRDVIAAIDAWMRLIQAVIATGAAPWIGLLKHWYTGDIETEPVLIHARRIIPLAALSSETLLLMDEDVVYEFQP